MKLMVFSENNSLRKQVEDLLTSTPHNFETFNLQSILSREKAAGFDGLLIDHESWQRCTVLFRYFGVLDVLNGKPLLVMSKSKKLPGMKMRSGKAPTLHATFPSNTDDFYTALQQMSNSLVTA